MQIGVVIFEDNQQLRESLVNMITFTKDMLVLGSFSEVGDIEGRIKVLKPEVILMDIDLPKTNGIEAVKKIRRFDQSVSIIMITVFDDNKHVYDAICNGASGYLLKKYLSEKLIDSIREVLQGGAPMSPSIARMVIAGMQQTPVIAEKDYGLSPREKEILTSLAKGNSYKMIAADFSISIDTVRTHIKRIYEKLQVHTQLEAVRKATNEKLV
jgi:DNA-binding NarL/FixJ family response regulator